MIRKNIQSEVVSLTKSYLSGEFRSGVAVFGEMYRIVADSTLTESESSMMRNLFQLFMLGQLVELETMRQICVSCGVTNSQHQVCYTSLCTRLSQAQLFQLFEEAFERALQAKLAPMLAQHLSAFSRTSVTLVLDDSVFKRCFSYTKQESEEFEIYFGCFFSGQFGKAVWGFQVLTFGVSVDNVFYPLYLRCVPKTIKAPVVKKSEKKAKKDLFNTKKQAIADLRSVISVQKALQATEETKNTIKQGKIDLKILVNDLKELKNASKKAKNPKNISKKIAVAIELVKKWAVFVKKLCVEGRKLPTFYLSCDNGYSDIDLSNAVTNLNIIYISVPKMSQCMTTKDGKTQQIQAYIKHQHAKLEAAHQQGEAHLPKAEKSPFVLRLRAHLCTQNRTLTFLFFRLNHSRNVSAIYCTDANIKAKTLRHHWFARTYIEQFFKILKHYLRIQNAKTSSIHDFHCKLFRFTFIALHCQLLLQYIRKQCKQFKTQGLGTLRIILRAYPDIYDLLNQAINQPFAA